MWMGLPVYATLEPYESVALGAFLPMLVPDGEDMELNGAVPDIVVWSESGEIPAGAGRQPEAGADASRRMWTRGGPRPSRRCGRRPSGGHVVGGKRCG